MFLAKVVMFLKRSRLPGYQLLDVEELGGSPSVFFMECWRVSVHSLTLRGQALELWRVAILCYVRQKNDSMSAGKRRQG